LPSLQLHIITLILYYYLQALFTPCQPNFTENLR